MNMMAAIATMQSRAWLHSDWISGVQCSNLLSSAGNTAADPAVTIVWLTENGEIYSYWKMCIKRSIKPVAAVLAAGAGSGRQV